MDERAQRGVPPILAAMAAMDGAVSAQKLFQGRLRDASEAAEQLDDAMRRAPPELREEVAQKLGAALGVVEQLARAERNARLDLRRAQAALEATRHGEHRQNAERLRIELTIDAASIWDFIGQFEAKMRERLERHAAIAEELAFASEAGGERLALPDLSTWSSAVGTRGPELLDALANGVRQLQQAAPSQPVPPPPVEEKHAVGPAGATRVARVDKKAARDTVATRGEAITEPPTAPAVPEFSFGIDRQAPLQAAAGKEPARGRLDRALQRLGRVFDSTPAAAKK